MKKENKQNKLNIHEEYLLSYEKYKNKYGTKTIVLMQVGSFFEVYGICDKNTDSMTGSKIIEFSHIRSISFQFQHLPRLKGVDLH